MFSSKFQNFKFQIFKFSKFKFQKFEISKIQNPKFQNFKFRNLKCQISKFKSFQISIFQNFKFRICDLSNYAARHPFGSINKNIKLWQNRSHIKDIGKSSSRKLCWVMNYLLCRLDPQKTLLNNVFYTNISKIRKFKKYSRCFLIYFSF